MYDTLFRPKITCLVCGETPTYPTFMHFVYIGTRWLVVKDASFIQTAACRLIVLL